MADGSSVQCSYRIFCKNTVEPGKKVCELHHLKQMSQRAAVETHVAQVLKAAQERPIKYYSKAAVDSELEDERFFMLKILQSSTALVAQAGGAMDKTRCGWMRLSKNSLVQAAAMRWPVNPLVDEIALVIGFDMETMFEGGVLGAVSITLSSEGRRRVYIIEMELVDGFVRLQYTDANGKVNAPYFIANHADTQEEIQRRDCIIGDWYLEVRQDALEIGQQWSAEMQGPIDVSVNLARNKRALLGIRPPVPFDDSVIDPVLLNSAGNGPSLAPVVQRPAPHATTDVTLLADNPAKNLMTSRKWTLESNIQSSSKRQKENPPLAVPPAPVPAILSNEVPQVYNLSKKRPVRRTRSLPSKMPFIDDALQA